MNQKLRLCLRIGFVGFFWVLSSVSVAATCKILLVNKAIQGEPGPRYYLVAALLSVCVLAIAYFSIRENKGVDFLRTTAVIAVIISTQLFNPEITEGIFKDEYYLIISYNLLAIYSFCSLIMLFFYQEIKSYIKARSS